MKQRREPALARTAFTVEEQAGKRPSRAPAVANE
jgi:hypothetical protein